MTFLGWVEDNPEQGFVAFTLVYALATLCFVPDIPLMLGAGYVFGRALGGGVGVFVGCVAVMVRYMPS